MDLGSLETNIAAWEQDGRLRTETSLAERRTVLESLTIFAEILARQVPAGADRDQLSARLHTLQAEFVTLNTALFQHLKARIQTGSYTPKTLRQEFNRYTAYSLPGQPHYGHDSLDELLDGLLGLTPRSFPAPLEPDMIHYEPAPARVILEFVDRANLQPLDVFYDIGSGLGRPAILTHLVTGLPTQGLENDAELCRLAQGAAAQLKLSSVTFSQGDARLADYEKGTAFFLFTPFKGQMFRAVMARLQQRATTGRIKVGTFGACSFWAATQPWLHPLGNYPLNDFTLALFESLP